MSTWVRRAGKQQALQRFSDGNIAEEWIEINLLGVLPQLGAFPAAAA